MNNNKIVQETLISMETNIWNIGLTALQTLENEVSSESKIDILQHAVNKIKNQKVKISKEVNEKVKQFEEYKSLTKAINEVEYKLNDTLELLKDLEDFKRLLRN